MNEMRMVTMEIPELLVGPFADICSKAGFAVKIHSQKKEVKERGWDPPTFKRMYDESPSSIKKLLTYLRKRAGHIVPAHELNAVFSQSAHAIPGALGAYTRRCNNRYNLPLPFTSIWVAEKRERQYGMSPAIAEIMDKALSS